MVDDLAGLDYGLVVRRTRRASSGGSRSDPLGFGLDTVAAMVTPLVLLVVDEACRAAVADGTGRLVNRAATALGRLRPSARRPLPPEVPRLDREQLASVRRRVRGSGPARLLRRRRPRGQRGRTAGPGGRGRTARRPAG
ncbi:hypothetical protein [Streptomyces canarius]